MELTVLLVVGIVLSFGRERIVCLASENFTVTSSGLGEWGIGEERGRLDVPACQHKRKKN